MITFGSDEVRKLFISPLESAGIRLNHGSFGLAPASVLKKRIELLNEQEQQPDVWFRINLEKYYNKTVEAAAAFIDADVDDTFIVDNTTTGINYVLKSLRSQPNDEILLTSHTYLAIQNTAKDIEKTGGFKVTYLPLTFPISDEDEVVKLYEKKLAENRNIKLVVLDHITSSSAVMLPIKRLVDLCRQYNAISIIDGAHAPGQVKLSMKELGADFYSGNFYKWVYTARSCAFLWISPSYRGQVLPLVTSNYTHKAHARFSYMGTRDYSNFYTLPTAIKFYEDVGGLNRITAYTDKLLTWAQAMMEESLGTQSLAIPHSMRAPSMALIGLPSWPQNRRQVTANQLVIDFWNNYAVQVTFSHIDGRMWIRVSANIYNNKDDFVKLRDSLLDYYQMNGKD